MARIKTIEEAEKIIIEIKAKYAAELQNTDHPDWCDAGPGDIVIGVRGGNHEVLFHGYGGYYGKFPWLALHEDSNVWTHGSQESRRHFRRLTL